MKIIRITELSPDREPVDIDFHPDSALLLPSRPMFYPDFGGDWQARVFTAVHVNRLGKSVSGKFAARYYDGVSAAVRYEPVMDGVLPSGVLSGMDSGITHGEWMAPQDLPAAGHLIINNVDSGVELTGIDMIDRMVEWVSRYTTLRMGDIIMIPLDLAPVPLTQHSHLTVALADGRLLMDVKIV